MGNGGFNQTEARVTHTDGKLDGIGGGVVFGERIVLYGWLRLISHYGGGFGESGLLDGWFPVIDPKINS